jgi:hypothetical protein
LEVAKKTYGHTVDSEGRAKRVDMTAPRGQRGIDPEWDVATIKDGPMRIFRRK